jgi:hypothetical protein
MNLEQWKNEMDNSVGSGKEISRRKFLQEVSITSALALAAGAALAGESSEGQVSHQSGPSSPAQNRTESKKFVAIQIGARSFVDEGVDKCLDTLQEKASVNVLMPAVFTYGRGLAGRQIPGRPLPDHGVQAYDEIHGGSYTKIHPEFYRNSVIQDVRAPELGDFDILADVTPKAKARGMKVYCLFEEAYNPKLMPNFEKIAEVDLYGKIGRSICFNNPNARTFLMSLVQDWFTNNDLDGMMWESERQGPLDTALTAGRSRRVSLCCFCRHCVQKGREQGIDVERARAGYIALDRWISQPDSESRQSDGSFVSLWRLLVEYPEIFAWHKLWFLSQEEIYGLLYGTVKTVNPRAKVGWHIMQTVTLSPFYRADENYARIAQAADFIKPSAYNNCAGPRFAQYIRNVQSTMFQDFTPQEVLTMIYKILGYEGEEASLEKLPQTGLTANYVAHETRRAIADVKGAVPIYTGIDIDIPTPLDTKQTQPSDVKAAVLAAFKAGASGVVLSRKYAEMKLANLAGAGEALRELNAA